MRESQGRGGGVGRGRRVRKDQFGPCLAGGAEMEDSQAHCMLYGKNSTDLGFRGKKHQEPHLKLFGGAVHLT